MKKRYIFSIMLLTLVILSVFNIERIKQMWFKVFNLDGRYIEYNNNGQIHGEAIEYINGKVHIRENFVNGMRVGWGYEYFDNGQLRRKTHFHKGQADGEEFLFNENGKIQQSRNFLRGKPYGDWLEYDTLGNIKSYVLFDITTKDIFSANVDRFGNLGSMHGFVVSPNLFSYDSSDHTVIFNDGESYLKRGMEDLFITVIHSPKYRLELEINIDGRNFKFDQIKGNTVKINKAFGYLGTYKIFIKSKLINNKQEVVNGINIQQKITMR